MYIKRLFILCLALCVSDNGWSAAPRGAAQEHGQIAFQLIALCQQKTFEFYFICMAFGPG